MIDPEQTIQINAAKRLSVHQDLPDGDFFHSWSGRSETGNASGMWCHWVHLARLILAHPLTQEQMGEFFLPYPDAAHVYAEHHPACTTPEAVEGRVEEQERAAAALAADAADLAEFERLKAELNL